MSCSVEVDTLVYLLLRFWLAGPFGSSQRFRCTDEDSRLGFRLCEFMLLPMREPFLAAEPDRLTDESAMKLLRLMWRTDYNMTGFLLSGVLLHLPIGLRNGGRTYYLLASLLATDFLKMFGFEAAVEL